MKTKSSFKTLFLLVNIALCSQNAFSRTFLIDNFTAKRLDTLYRALERANMIYGRDTVIISLPQGVKTVTVSITNQLPAFYSKEHGTVLIGPGSDRLIFDASHLEMWALVGIPGNHNVISGISITVVKFYGILIQGSNNLFLDVVLEGRHDNPNAVLCEVIGGGHNIFMNCEFHNSGIGIRCTGNSVGNVIKYSMACDNLHSGMSALNAHYNHFYRNDIDGSCNSGMFLIVGSQCNIIEYCTISNVDEFGIYIDRADAPVQASYNIIRNNIIRWSPYGKYPAGSESRNTIINNKE